MSIQQLGIDGRTYEHDEGSEYGFCAGCDEGVYMGMTTIDYFVTDGVKVLRCEGIATWDDCGSDELGCLFEEWESMIANGEEGYSVVAGK